MNEGHLSLSPFRDELVKTASPSVVARQPSVSRGVTHASRRFRRRAEQPRVSFPLLRPLLDFFLLHLPRFTRNFSRRTSNTKQSIVKIRKVKANRWDFVFRCVPRPSCASVLLAGLFPKFRNGERIVVPISGMSLQSDTFKKYVLSWVSRFLFYYLKKIFWEDCLQGLQLFERKDCKSNLLKIFWHLEFKLINFTLWTFPFLIQRQPEMGKILMKLRIRIAGINQSILFCLFFID